MRRRKPDLMVVLAIAIGMGVLVTGWAQANFAERQPPAPIDFRW